LVAVKKEKKRERERDRERERERERENPIQWLIAITFPLPKNRE
jgi:hypothetical protein